MQEVTVDDYVDGRGEDARDVRRVKFKLADKRAALVDIGKHLGMFTDRFQHTGKDGKDLIPENAASPDRLAQALLVVLGAERRDEGLALPSTHQQRHNRGGDDRPIIGIG